MGLWGSLVAFQVWDLTTPVQIRAFPLLKMEYHHFVGRLSYELIGKKIKTDKFTVQLGIIHSPSKRDLGRLAIIEDDRGAITLGTISNDSKDVEEFVRTQGYKLIVGHHEFVKRCAGASGTLASLWKSA